MSQGARDAQNDLCSILTESEMGEIRRKERTWNLPVVNNSPRKEINVSLPQQRINPVEKWGRPAANEIWNLYGS